VRTNSAQENPVDTEPTLEQTESSEQPLEDAELVEEELLVEEISIDGMCGVY
jgi:mycofactocin precursor